MKMRLLIAVGIAVLVIIIVGAFYPPLSLLATITDFKRFDPSFLPPPSPPFLPSSPCRPV
jgi:hypothetical protein